MCVVYESPMQELLGICFLPMELRKISGNDVWCGVVYPDQPGLITSSLNLS